MLNNIWVKYFIAILVYTSINVVHFIFSFERIENYVPGIEGFVVWGIVAPLTGIILLWICYITQKTDKLKRLILSILGSAYFVFTWFHVNVYNCCGMGNDLNLAVRVLIIAEIPVFDQEHYC